MWRKGRREAFKRLWFQNCAGSSPAIRTLSLNKKVRRRRVLNQTMAAALMIIIGVVSLWTAGLADWIVAYATGVAQLGIWLTLLSLIPFALLWVSLKRMPFTELPSHTARAHWSVQLKIS